MDFSKLTKRKDALDLLYGRWKPSPEIISIDLEQAAGYVLAEDQYSQHAIPVVRASGMDGIAVDSRCFEAGMPDTSKWEEGREYDRADTGDDFDDAYDAVIPIECVTFPEDGGIIIDVEEPVKKGMHVNGCGSNLARDALLIQAGTVLAGRHIALLAQGGITEIPVIKRPKVAFIPTGSELVRAGTPLSRGQNIDCNSILAKYMLEEMGAEPVCYPIVKDKKTDLENMLDTALEECDIVIINAGSSKGKEDFNTRLLREKGDLLCHEVAAVPGRPMGIAVINEKAVINLAGPPVAALYGLHWIIRSMICKWLGIPEPEGNKVEVTLGADLMSPPPLEMMALLELRKENGKLVAYPHRRGETGRKLPALAAEAIFVTELGVKGYKKGERILAELL